MATVLDRNPTNKDLLQSTKFRLEFARLPGTTYFCQSINVPGVSLSEVPRHTPFVDLYVPGEKMMYETLNVTLLIDEDIRAWQERHDWIRAMTFPTDFQEYRALSKLSETSAIRRYNKLPPQYTDATMSVYTNKNNLNLKIVYKDLFPTTLSSILFNSSDSADNVLTADVSFRFSYYNIERI